MYHNPNDATGIDSFSSAFNSNNRVAVDVKCDGEPQILRGKLIYKSRLVEENWDQMFQVNFSSINVQK